MSFEGSVNCPVKEVTVHLTSTHESLLSRYNHTNQSAAEYVNLTADIERPKIHQIVTFVVPSRALPIYPRTIGDIGRSICSMTEDESRNYTSAFLGGNTSDAITKSNCWMFICLFSCLVCDPCAGSPHYLDILETIKERQKVYRASNIERLDKEREKDKKKLAAQKEGQEASPNDKDEIRTEILEHVVDNLVIEKKNKAESASPDDESNNDDDEAEENNEEEAEGEEGKEENNEVEPDVENKEEADTETVKDVVVEDNVDEHEKKDDDDVIVEENTKKDDDDEVVEKVSNNKKSRAKNKDAIAKRLKEKREKVEKQKLDKITEVEQELMKENKAFFEIKKKRIKTAQDWEYIKRTTYFREFRKTHDIRGMNLSGNYLYYTYGKRLYPKVLIYLEELEGHSDMPRNTCRMTLDAELDTEMEGNQDSSIRHGNRKLVGYRFWFLVLDMAFDFSKQLDILMDINAELRSSNISTKNTKLAYVPHPMKHYVRPINGLTNQNNLVTQLYIPYFSHGSSFREVQRDPCSSDVLQNKEVGFDINSRISGEESENHNKDPFSVSVASRNSKLAQVMSYTKGFSMYMNEVCEAQRNPENYFDFSDPAIAIAAAAKAKQAKIDMDDEPRSTTKKSFDPADDFGKEIFRDSASYNMMDPIISPTPSLLGDSLDNNSKRTSTSTTSTSTSTSTTTTPVLSSLDKRKAKCFISNNRIIYGYSDAADYEEYNKKIFEKMKSVQPHRFKGFPIERRVTKIHNEFSGLTLLNMPLPHILREAKYHQISKVLKTFRETNDVVESLRQVIGVDTDEWQETYKNEDGSISLEGGEGTTLNNNIESFYHRLFESELETKETIDASSIIEKAQGEDGCDGEIVKDEMRRAADIRSQRDPKTTDESIKMLVSSSLVIRVKTPTDVNFLMTGKREPVLIEINRTLLSASEMEIYAGRNDILALRLKYACDVATITNRYPLLCADYCKAIAEIKKIHCNDFMYTFMNSSRLPRTVIDAREWYRAQVSKKRIFTSIPLSYANLTLFGNGIQFIRGVWAEVMLGRNNVDLFFLFWTIYLTSINYTFDLRPHLIVSGIHTSSKSFNLECVQNLAVEGTYESITHETSMHLMQEEDIYYKLQVYHEAPISFGIQENSKSRESNSSSSGGDRLLKDAMARGRASIRTFFFLREKDGTQRRMTAQTNVVLQNTVIMLSNMQTLSPESPLMQRFLFYVHAKKDGSEIWRADAASEAKKYLPHSTIRDKQDKKMCDEVEIKHVFARQQDLAKMSLDNMDYRDDADETLKSTIKLIHFYMFLVELMITAGFLENVSVDISERILTTILDYYTRIRSLPSISARKMRQFTLIVRSLAVFDAVITTLFTDHLHQELKKEQIVISSKDKFGNIAETKTIRECEFLNIEKFADKITRLLYVKTEHVVFISTLVEPFVSSPYQTTICASALAVVGWPETIQIWNMRAVSYNDHNLQYCTIPNPEKTPKNEKGVKRLDNINFDARYIAICNHKFEDIYHAVTKRMHEQISVNDVKRVFFNQERTLFFARGCLILSREKWYERYENRNKYRDDDATKEVIVPSSEKDKPSDAEELAIHDDVIGDAIARTLHQASINSYLVPKPPENVVVPMEAENKKVIDTTRNHVQRVDGTLYYQPGTIKAMSAWFIELYETYDQFLDDMRSGEENRRKYGIDQIFIFPGGDAVWMMFNESIVPGEKIPIIHSDPDPISNKRRISVLIEHAIQSFNCNMKTAILATLASNSIPEEGYRFMSAKPFVGRNEINKREESSSYLNDIVDIPYVKNKSVFCVSPIIGTTGAKKYLQIEKHLGKNKFVDLSAADKPSLNSHVNKKREKDGANSTSSHQRSDIDGEDNEEDEEDAVDLAIQLKKDKTLRTPYQINADISSEIRYAKGISFDNMNIDDYGQLRHYYRCGLDPKKLISAISPDGKTKTIYKEQERYSSHFIDQSMQLMLLQKCKDDPSVPICTDYPSTLWLEEYTESMEKNAIAEPQCTKTRDLFSDYFYNGKDRSSSTSSGKLSNKKGGCESKGLFNLVLNEQAKKLRTAPIINTKNTEEKLASIRKNEERMGRIPGISSDYQSRLEENKNLEPVYNKFTNFVFNDKGAAIPVAKLDSTHLVSTPSIHHDANPTAPLIKKEDEEEENGMDIDSDKEDLDLSYESNKEKKLQKSKNKRKRSYDEMNVDQEEVELTHPRKKGRGKKSDD